MESENGKTEFEIFTIDTDFSKIVFDNSKNEINLLLIASESGTKGFVIRKTPSVSSKKKEGIVIMSSFIVVSNAMLLVLLVAQKIYSFKKPYSYTLGFILLARAVISFLKVAISRV